MSRKDELKAQAAETVEILERGSYSTPNGGTVDIGDAILMQEQGTVWHRASDDVRPRPAPEAATTIVEVTDEFSGAAVLARGDLPGDTLCLVFASARRPGGGFLDGANAQEESLARSSTLSASLLSVPGFYEGHKEDRDLRYSDGMIYTPHSRMFRDEHGILLDEPVRCAFLTAPAPNAGAMERNQPDDLRSLPTVLERRAGRILDACALHGHRRLVLGAWGCGVFGNDPHTVATAFLKALATRPWFKTVTFAIPDASSQQHVAFRKVLRP